MTASAKSIDELDGDPAWICGQCAAAFPASEQPPAACPICTDERQYVPTSGQRWTTRRELAAAGHRSEIREVEPGLLGVGSEPRLGVGQRGLLVRTSEGNVLWDPSGFIDQQAIDAVAEAGGLRAVTSSHPHMYGAMVDWARAFGAEIVLPEADLHWLTRPEPGVRTWSGTLALLPGVTLVQCGGHFPGSAVLHWADGADGKGALLTGDTMHVTPGADRVTFAWSVPNQLPMPERGVRGIIEALRPFDYDRVHPGWWAPVLETDARAVVERCAERYIGFLRGEVEVPLR